MGSLGNSSLKAERKEWENEPNVAASEDVCNPWFLASTNDRLGREETGNDLERVTFFDEQPH